MTDDSERAEGIGAFREILGRVAESGPSRYRTDYETLRTQLVDDEQVRPLVPDFVIECRSERDFWNHIKRVFPSGSGEYRVWEKRTQYIEAQLLPIERQFRPERDKAPGIRPPEVRIEYSPVRPVSTSGLTFVNENRIAGLRQLPKTPYDLAKLIRLCEELNVAYSGGCYYATAMLTRSLLDHIPPLFRCGSFTEVANNVAGKSTKGTLRRLDEVSRNIADTHLHRQIASREVLPTQQQVDFRAEVDVLIGEIVKTLSPTASTS